MSPATLIINKFESGSSFKSLYITIKDEESTIFETSFSEWVDGKSLKKKEAERSPRLVVKIVSGEEIDKLNLDACAIKVEDFDKYLNDAPRKLSLGQYSYKPFLFSDSVKSEQNTHISEYFVQNDSEPQKIFEKDLTYQIKAEDINFIEQYDKENVHCSNNEDIDKYCANNPLEHSLEKVKENNARIMENIQMLNRTLNYTKNKEILDIGSPKSTRSYTCTTCGKCFVYETGLRRHCAIRHAMSEMQPRWQIVWTCIQCFQVWPQQDQALKHSIECCKSENTDYAREIKTSSLLRCEFCEKVFTSIPRLLRHSKTHTTANNYECNACEMAFLSYKTAEQHWLLCPWLKTYYSFALPKSLLCNACDRKFRNYDQLYNHRYKIGHFMTKSQCIPDNTNPLGLLVYQCEVCSQCYSSVPSLQIHRSQFHTTSENGIQFRIDNRYEETCSSYYVPAENEYLDTQTED